MLERTLLIALLSLAANAQETEPRYQSIFDGRSLEGWAGDPALWSVEDGAIVGRGPDGAKIPETTYLVWRGGEVTDFELSLEYKLVGGNSGVQFRSREVADFNVAGYQADLEDGPNWSGCLYEQDGRGVVARRGQEVELTPEGKNKKQVANGAELNARVRKGGWNHYYIRAVGNRIELALNGARTVTVVDNDEKRVSLRGILAFQLHAGPPMEVRFKNIRLLDLGARGADDSDKNGQLERSRIRPQGDPKDDPKDDSQDEKVAKPSS